MASKLSPKVTSEDSVHAVFEGNVSKDDVMNALLSHHNLLSKIPLPLPTVSIEQAQKDFRRERVLLNDVPFIPDQVDINRSNGFSMCLNRLVQRLQQGIELDNTQTENIANIIMQRACRTSAGADSFFMVQRFLCVESTFVSQKTSPNDPPIRVDVFLVDSSTDEALPTMSSNSSTSTRPISNSTSYLDSRPNSTNSNSSHSQPCNNAVIADLSQLKSFSLRESSVALCARVEIRNFFAVYDVSAMDNITGVEANDPPPWLDIEATVIDESNFKTGENWRRMQLRVNGLSTPSKSSQSSFRKALLSPLRPKKHLSPKSP